MLYKGSATNGITVYLHRVKTGVWPFGRDRDGLGGVIPAPELATDPVARTDKDGKWVALNVPTGNYICNAFRLRFGNLAYMRSSVREIKEGQVVDFGPDETDVTD